MKLRLPAAFAFLLFFMLPARAESELFQRMSLEAEGGYVFPAGNLSPILDPQPELGLRITSSYYGPLAAHARFHASRQDGGGSPVPVLMAAAGVGLEWRGPSWYLPAAGLGVSLNYARVSHANVPVGREFFMEDGESEFGFYPFLRWHIPLGGSWFLVADVVSDVILTEPEYSRMFSTHLGAGWRWK
jgi:hypothetical protein